MSPGGAPLDAMNPTTRGRVLPSPPWIGHPSAQRRAAYLGAGTRPLPDVGVGAVRGRWLGHWRKTLAFGCWRPACASADRRPRSRILDAPRRSLEASGSADRPVRVGANALPAGQPSPARAGRLGGYDASGECLPAKRQRTLLR